MADSVPLLVWGHLSSARKSGTVLLGSGGGSPLARRAPKFHNRDCRRHLAGMQHPVLRTQKPTASGVALPSGTGDMVLAYRQV